MIHYKNAISENEVTDFSIYTKRRDFIKASLSIGLLATTGNGLLAEEKKAFSSDEKLTTYQSITSYCNFYEFGTKKHEPKKNAHHLSVSPWSIEIEGECNKTGRYHLEDILKPRTIEERIYRLRCVEGWSMVIPWMGFPLADLIKQFEPNSKTQFVHFETLYDPKQMLGQRRTVLDWPYVEGLRIDEAMHPLTLIATGLYGNNLLNQNGAPLRLVVPWKYGFKSIKSIVKIRFSSKPPINSWQKANAHEYGFYANVNPQVSHPRWSQRRERRIGEFRKRKTELFNGYSEQVASLYTGMDLQKHF